MVTCTFLDEATYRARDEERREAIKAWREAHPEVDLSTGWPDELRALDALYLPPGSMWYCPWYLDPEDTDPEKVAEHIRRMEAEPDKHWHLSIHYWRDWALIRPPICVICPGGGHWVPDSKSSNGSGWTVTGQVPRITASPSIWVSQGAGPPREYHGFLNDGVFSPPL